MTSLVLLDLDELLYVALEDKGTDAAPTCMAGGVPTT